MDRNDYYGGESSSLNLTKVNLADTYIYYTVIDRSTAAHTFDLSLLNLRIRSIVLIHI